MKVVWKWLNDYAEIPWDPEEAAERFTMAGLKVESMEYDRLDLSGVVSAKVIEVRPHPKRPDQKVGILYDGSNSFTVVSGAPGLNKDNVVLLARPGAKLPGGLVIAAMDLAGVSSQGMVVCSSEILEGQTHRPNEDIVILPKGTVLGKKAQDLLGLDDYVIELELTVNYSHCLSMLGVAMEAAALSGARLKLPKILDEWNWSGPKGSRPPVGRKKEYDFEIELPDPDLCPKYVGKIVKNVTVGYSPVWMERRLMLAGMRPVNAVADVTNYVMLETGQPLHAFDLDSLEGRFLSARRSEPGETILTLDGESRDLLPGTLVIADESGPVAVAGVMGNKSTEVTQSTRNILIESAYFAPIPVRRTYRQLKLRTEAALRFEKGVDPTAQAGVAERAAFMVMDLSGGCPQEGYAEKNLMQAKPRFVKFRASEVVRTLGADIPGAHCKNILESLRFGVDELQEMGGEAVFGVTVPPRRVDIQEPVDLIEEIARYHGVNFFEPLYLDSAVPGGPPDRDYEITDRLRDILVSLGGLECVGNSLVSPQDISAMAFEADDPRRKPVPLLNPLSSNESLLRTSLLPGMVKVSEVNEKQKITGGLFWEMGRVFFDSAGQELPLESVQLAIMSFGMIKPNTWLQEQLPASFFHMKGVVQSLLQLLGIENIAYLPRCGMPFHPGKSARIVAAGSVIGEFGEVHPVVQKNVGVLGPLVLAWFSMDALLALAKEATYTGISRFMPVERDLAVIVSEDVPVGDITACVTQSARDLLSLEVFDVWRGSPVPKGKKSVAMRLCYQSHDRTLTEEELQADRLRIMEALSSKYNAEQRV